MLFVQRKKKLIAAENITQLFDCPLVVLCEQRKPIDNVLFRKRKSALIDVGKLEDYWGRCQRLSQFKCHFYCATIIEKVNLVCKFLDQKNTTTTNAVDVFFGSRVFDIARIESATLV